MTTTPWPRAIVVALGAAAALAVVALAFLWPSVTSTVQGIPLAVVGDSAALPAQLSEPFDTESLPTREGAVAAIESREVYGALVLGPTPEVLMGSANGPAVSQLFGQVASTFGTEVTDVVPFASTDARGAGLSALAFPMVIGGIIGGAVISMTVVGTWRRLAATATYGLGAGVVIVLITQFWMGILHGGVATNVAAVALSVLAISTLIVGLTSIIGPAGIAAGALVMMFVGNPISGAAQPAQFLPGSWGSVGQLLPPGAASTLLRNLSYFPDAPNAQSWWVLTAWIAAGVLLMAVGHRRTGRAAHASSRVGVAAEPDHVAL